MQGSNPSINMMTSRKTKKQKKLPKLIAPSLKLQVKKALYLLVVKLSYAQVSLSPPLKPSDNCRRTAQLMIREIPPQIWL